MINKQANILFIPTSIGGNGAEPQDIPSQPGYYQQLIYASLARSIYTIEGFRSLAKRLAAIARQAYWAKQIDVVEQATQVMLALPISDQLQHTARYYQALCAKQRGDLENARRLLECVADESTPQYRARALQVIGATYFERGEVDSSLQFYLAAGKAAAGYDLLTLAASQKMTAVVRSIHGDHKQALADLEKLFPLVRSVAKDYPVLYYDFLNGLAVELSEAGRLAEADAALSIALASPFATAYPEWSETRHEIAARRDSATPSVVAINRAPEAAPSSQTALDRKPKTVARLTFNWPVGKRTFLQRASTTIAATAATFLDGVTQSIVDRVLICTGPRAPPAVSESISN